MACLKIAELNAHLIIVTSDTSTQFENFELSEGIDFKHHSGRAVIIVGVPNADINATEMHLKQRHCQRIDYPWQLYYHYQTQMTVNQAVGRVIRDKNDYGAVILIDMRYASYWHKGD